jgi:hypothetical protein
MFQRLVTRLTRLRRPFAIMVWAIALFLTGCLACSAWEAVNAAGESKRLYSAPTAPFAG